MVMGSGVDGGGQVVPLRIRKTIQSIKEIVGNHSDADIYAVLKETNMDPNETAQKLLNQDPFHEVKRKRDRKKEVFSAYINYLPVRIPVSCRTGMYRVVRALPLGKSAFCEPHRIE
ncbi:hypothetical protein BHM03_00037601 [Ensete ventricosum]|nr:hypothetical protein BHM03_00037601 [Ensete ventricosum]